MTLGNNKKPGGVKQMIKDQLRELGVRLDQMEQVALAIPAEYWPDAFDAVL